MSNHEDEFWDDDDIIGEFMIEEPEDITLVTLPKLDIDIEELIDGYVRLGKRCKNAGELRNVFFQFYGHIVGITNLQNDIRFLQDKAKEIEMNMEFLKGEYGS